MDLWPVGDFSLAGKSKHINPDISLEAPAHFDPAIGFAQKFNSMNAKTNGAAVCSECGAKMLNSINVCPECGDTDKVNWGKESDRSKLLWVIATVFFLGLAHAFKGPCS